MSGGRRCPGIANGKHLVKELGSQAPLWQTRGYLCCFLAHTEGMMTRGDLRYTDVHPTEKVSYAEIRSQNQRPCSSFLASCRGERPAKTSTSRITPDFNLTHATCGRCQKGENACRLMCAWFSVMPSRSSMLPGDVRSTRDLLVELRNASLWALQRAYVERDTNAPQYPKQQAGTPDRVCSSCCDLFSWLSGRALCVSSARYSRRRARVCRLSR